MDPIAGEQGTGEGGATFLFRRSPVDDSTLTVNFRTNSSGYTALPDVDYVSLGNTVTFGPGAATATKTVTVLEDQFVEGDEFIEVVVVDGPGYIAFPRLPLIASATVTIKDDDKPVITVTASDAVAGEPGTDKGTGTFTFTRAGYSGSPTTTLGVGYAVDGTASRGVDYVVIGTAVTFNVGSTTATKTVTANGDTLVEGDETVRVTLTAGSFYTIGTPASAIVTIQDDDETVVTVVASDSSAEEPGSGLGTGTFTFTRTGPLGTALTATYTVNGTARAGLSVADNPPSDYTRIGTTVTFESGLNTAIKVVNVIDDAMIEPIETVVVAPGTIWRNLPWLSFCSMTMR